MIAKRVTEIRLNAPLEIIVANVTKIAGNMPTRMVLWASSDSLFNVIDPEQADKVNRQTVATRQTTSKAHIQ